MIVERKCPVCLNSFSTTAHVAEGGGRFCVKCPVCGSFEIADEAYEDFLDPQNAVGGTLSKLSRARIAHRLRTARSDGPHPSRLTSDFLDQFIKAGCPGPSVGEQVNNVIQYIGDEVTRTGEKIALQDDFFAAIGSPSPELASELVNELQRGGLLSGTEIDEIGASPGLVDVNLTLKGWQDYESGKKGKRPGTHGFLAMKFGDPHLDPLARDVIKPTLKSELTLDIYDMRDIARAGLIDNIMRAQIRDAAFTIVDLTHDNSGAYWEAGYAEGLGKPVIYICEKTKFEQAKSHFDTNHCTTVTWGLDDLNTFRQQLVATVRRSLNIF